MLTGFPPVTVPSLAVALSPIEGEMGGGEANLVLPDLGLATIHGIPGSTLLLIGMLVCVVGLISGLVTFLSPHSLLVHKSMSEVAELIYSTCKAHLVKQSKFLLFLWVFITTIIFICYKILVGFTWAKVAIMIGLSSLGMVGFFAIAWLGIQINTFANTRTASALLKGRPYPVHFIPLQAGMSIDTVLISTELLMMLIILVSLSKDVAGACFIGFVIGESLGASVLCIVGDIFTKTADIGADSMKIVFKIDRDDPRNLGVIADCIGDNAGDSVGPSVDGFEIYGVTGVALAIFVVLAVDDLSLQALLLIWIFVVCAVMTIGAALAYALNTLWVYAKHHEASRMNFEIPLTSLVWATSIMCIILTYGVTWFIMADQLATLWAKLATTITCGTLAKALILELVKVLTSTNSHFVRETVEPSCEGGASLNILSGLVAGNMSGYWLGIIIVGLMGVVFLISEMGLGTMMQTPEVFAFDPMVFGFLGMGPVTIAVGSYGPVTDNAQSAFELSRIESVPGIKGQLMKEYAVNPVWEKAKLMPEDNDGTGSTFKVIAKPVLIGTAVVGVTTMIFSIIMSLIDSLHNQEAVANLSPLRAPFLLGLITGGVMAYWSFGASTQAVIIDANRAVAFIKDNIKLDANNERASVSNSRRAVETCTQYAQQGVLLIFLVVFFATPSSAFVEPYLFIGYLTSTATPGLYQVVFMANADGAWDNVKKVVEVDLYMEGTELHDATIVGDTVGDPLKDTSSVALSPIIKFTTLSGLLAVEPAASLTNQGQARLVRVLTGVLFIILAYFVWVSFYRIRIRGVAAKDSMNNHEPPTDTAINGVRNVKDLVLRSTGMTLPSSGADALIAASALDAIPDFDVSETDENDISLGSTSSNPATR